MLTFYPLYWEYHDCWKWKETVQGNPKNIEKTYNHAGHVHLFLMDYNPLKQACQQAYVGKQTYSFELEDKWGPNSTNSNQVRSYRLIGKPRWYFHIEEYWRRMYIQPWDIEDYSLDLPNHHGRIGIRYDASKECHRFGPFREGRGLYFFNTSMNRTLPIEYWLNEEKTKREHFLRKTHYTDQQGNPYSWDETLGGQTWSFEDYKRTWYRHSKGEYWEGDNATYSSDYYHSIGSYQKNDIVCVVQPNGKKVFYKNTLIPSTPIPTYGDKYFPNPTPGATDEVLRSDYLRYFGMNFMHYGSSQDSGYGYGEKFIVEYSRWKTGKTGEEADLFSQFIESKRDEMFGVCFGGTFSGWTFNEPQSYDTLRYEYVSFEDFKSIWEKIPEEEARKQGLYGDYPMYRDSYDPDAPKENPYDETYHDAHGNDVDPFEEYKKVFTHRDVYTIPRGSICSGDSIQKAGEFPNYVESYSDEDGARRTYSDNLYISPIIEYQTVVQLNYERLPAAADSDKNIDIWTDNSGAFGDGFQVSVEIPFKKNGMIQSPFSDDKKKVYPIGVYCHEKVEDSNKFRYAFETYGEKTSEQDIEKYTEELAKWEQKKQEAISHGEEFTEKKPSGPFDKVKRYRLADYLEFMEDSPSAQEQVEWFNTYYAERPIVQNYEEGRFVNHNWIPVVTNDRPDDTQVEHDEIGPIIKRQTGVDSQGNPIYEDALKDVQFKMNGYREDGIWVEQCLGAKVTPKVELVFEDALGHRWIEWVDSIQAKSATGFVGK